MTDILVIEDNCDIASTLCDFLRREGYSCYHCTTGEDGLAYPNHETVRLVLLDIMLPQTDGFQICREIYQNRRIPTIILSAKTDKDDKLNGLRLGADDYIEKPYDIDLLLAKINVLYRRHYHADNRKYITAGELKIDVPGRSVYQRGTPLSLTLKEYELLLFFLRNQEKILPKDFIFDAVWGVDSFSEPSTLTVHIKWLREKIEADPKNPRHIQTVWGVGYKFQP